jgi:hypothetical protein
MRNERASQPGAARPKYRCLAEPTIDEASLLAACRLVQAREPATGIIVIEISVVLDCAGAINNLPGLIKFKRYLGEAVEIAVWIGAHHERNLWFGKPDFSCRFHRTCSFASFSGTSLIQESHASLSLGSPRETCYSAPNICSSPPERCGMGCDSQLRTLSECNNCRSRASRSDTSHFWG